MKVKLSWSFLMLMNTLRCSKVSLIFVIFILLRNNQRKRNFPLTLIFASRWIFMSSEHLNDEIKSGTLCLLGAVSMMLKNLQPVGKSWKIINEMISVNWNRRWKWHGRNRVEINKSSYREMAWNYVRNNEVQDGGSHCPLKW